MANFDRVNGPIDMRVWKGRRFENISDSNVSTDRGINLTNTTDRHCEERATITEYGPSNHIDAMLSKPSMDIENRIESVSRRLCFALHSTRSRTLKFIKEDTDRYTWVLLI
jgi:hypothetical protein